jgi:hypothetical protein
MSVIVGSVPPSVLRLLIVKRVRDSQMAFLTSFPGPPEEWEIFDGIRFREGMGMSCGAMETKGNQKPVCFDSQRTSNSCNFLYI